ncbi:uncharacterized protein LOC21409920 isoform X1 [Morus notabilis]|uniref:uncharacterized protein LOC21409920 isoform X1 n=1 Tax=Morus notabilis TaxID=981085 RepID=UPI000CECF2F0|nr:uncharacterized protein LOC21409920 isoform X1 [Morus notabilis]
MEETQIETVKTSDKLVFFPPHRRRHLKSETYRTLVRIFSQFCDESPSSLATHNVDHELNTENGGDEFGQTTEKQASQQVELVRNDSMEAKSLVFEKECEVTLSGDNNGSQDRRLNEQMTINQIEQLMRLDENDGLSNQKAEIGFQNPGIGPEQMLIDELEHIVKGKRAIVLENNLKPPQIPLVENRSDINEDELLYHKEEHVDLRQSGIKRSVSACQTLSSSDDDIRIGGSASPREKGENIHSLLNNEVMLLNNSSIAFNESGEVEKAKNHAQKGCEDSNLLLDKNTVADTLDASNNNDGQGSPKADALKVDHEMPVKDKELENPVCGGDTVGSAGHMTEDVDMEEGEISGYYSMDDISMDTLLQDAEVLEGKRESEEPLNRCLKDKREFLGDEPNEADSGSTFFAFDKVDKNNNGAVGLREIDFSKTICATDIVVHKETLGAGKLDVNDSVPPAQKIEKKGTEGINNVVLCGRILEDDATRHYKVSTQKEDSKVHLKRKRGPSTKENKAKKKAKERKKRAEKNRQLGVKRLKLPLISKPKTVSYCRHYLNGRCQEGDNCKFSHDIVPLTKSKPCCYFARQQCMKGDDCPFDHELSKYPCSNFVSKGFCSRGDDCMFSHKIVAKDGSITVSKAMETEMKLASSMDNSMSKKQQKNDGAFHHTSSLLSYSKQMCSQKNPEKNVKETVSKQSEMVAKGTSFLSIVANAPLGDSNKLKQQILSPNNENRSEQSGSSVVQNSNEILSKTPPVVAPKGINFLAFGVQRDDLSCRKSGSVSSSGDSGAVQNSNEILNRTPPVVAPKGINFLAFGVQRDDLSSRKLGSTSSSQDNGVKLSPLENSNTHNQNSSASYSNLMLKGIQPAAVPKGISFLSFGKGSTDDSCNKGKAVLASSLDNGTDICVKGKEKALDEPKLSITTSSDLASSIISQVQSSSSSASRIFKDTPHSAQMALLSTLAFAAKCESRTKLNQSNRDPSVATETDKDTRHKGVIGCSQDDLAKASKILEFLSSIGSKSKQ